MPQFSKNYIDLVSSECSGQKLDKVVRMDATSDFPFHISQTFVCYNLESVSMKVEVIGIREKDELAAVRRQREREMDRLNKLKERQGLRQRKGK
jgi:hypothetical protein